MTHVRHFGVPKVTGGIAPGAQQRPRPHISAHDTQRAEPNQLASAIPPDAAWLNSRGFGRELFIQDNQPVIEPYELGSCLLFLFVMLAPAAAVCGAVLGYLLFVA